MDHALRSLRVFLSAVSSQPPRSGLLSLSQQYQGQLLHFQQNIITQHQNQNNTIREQNVCIQVIYIRVIVHGLNTEISYSISPIELKLR